MSTPKPILFDSFGYLLILFREGKFKGDAPHHVYHFNTFLEGAKDPDVDYSGQYKVSPEDIDGILKDLETAESEGRLQWRRGLTSQDELGRFLNTLVALRKLGAEIPEWSPSVVHFDAFWNVPAMRRFLKDSVEYANGI